MEKQNAPERTTGGLPGETIDNIIDHLHDDDPTLSASSLVCRAWLPSCRYHLFETIYCNPASSTGTLSHLHNWLLASPDIHPYIKTLTVSVPEIDITLPEIAVEDLEQVLLSLSDLQGLVLRRVSLSLRNTSDVSLSYVSSMGGARRIRTLTIDRCAAPDILFHSAARDKSFHSLCHILGLFAEVDQLAIQRSSCLLDDILDGATAPRLLELAHHFKVCSSLTLLLGTMPRGEEEVICYLLEHATEEGQWPLQNLSLAPAFVPSGSAARIIQRCRNTLQSLYLNINILITRDVVRGHPIQPADYWTPLRIHDCPLLNHITLPFEAVPHKGFKPHIIRDFRIASLASSAELVRQAPPSVKELTLEFWLSDNGVAANFHLWEQPELASGWRSVDDALTRLPALELVHATFYLPDGDLYPAHTHTYAVLVADVAWTLVKQDTASQRAFLKRVLPKAYAEGIFHIVTQERN